MAPSITVKIIIEEDGRIFFPGETVKGVIEINVLKKTSINTVQVKAKGFAKVKWTKQKLERKFGHTLARSHVYSKKEYYYIKNQTLYSKGKTPKELSEGKYKFKFSYELPTHIPCSFESKFGKLRHACKAVVNVVGKVFDVKHYALLSVGTIVDLNCNSMAKKPIVEFDFKKALFSKMDANSLKLISTLKIDHSGFVPGENLFLKAACFNKSKKPTNYTELALYQTVTFRTNSNKKITKTKIGSKVHAGIKPGTDDVWSKAVLTIPSVSPSGLMGCSIIDLNYHLEFTVSQPFPSRNLNVYIPIIIGTIPLKETFRTFVPGYSGKIGSNSNRASSAMTAKQPTPKHNVSFPWTKEYPHLPSPTFKNFSRTEAGPTKYSDSKIIAFSPHYVYFNQRVSKEVSSKSLSDAELKLELLSLAETKYGSF